MGALRDDHGRTRMSEKRAASVDDLRREQMARKLRELYWRWVDAGRPRKEQAR